MAILPYITAPGNIEKALRALQSAATPERVSQDFVKEILKIKGGSGNQITSFLKKIGFANSDGTPSDLYKRFRNSGTRGRAAADALKIAYRPLYVRNEFMHQLSDEKLRGLIIEETGQSDASTVVSLVLASIKALKKFVDSSSHQEETNPVEPNSTALAPAPKRAQNADNEHSPQTERIGLNLSYTINLNLPATSDVAVFNAIFKSLKENLLRGKDE